MHYIFLYDSFLCVKAEIGKVGSCTLPYLLRCSSLSALFFISLDCTYLKVPAAMVCIIFLIFEGVLFGLFTLAMFCTQVCSICKDETVNNKRNIKPSNKILSWLFSTLQ